MRNTQANGRDRVRTARRRGAGVVAAAIAAAGLGTGAAEVAAAGNVAVAATEWNLTGTYGDVVGAWGHGTVTRLSDGRVRVTAGLKDTKRDGRHACLRIQRQYRDGTARTSYLFVGGYGKTTGSSYTFAATTLSIRASEGVGNNHSCYYGKYPFYWHTIWRR